MLQLYHQFIEHSLNGFGPWLLLIGLALACFVPVTLWEASMARRIGSVQAARKSSWVVTAGFLLLLLLALYCGLHP